MTPPRAPLARRNGPQSAILTPWDKENFGDPLGQAGDGMRDGAPLAEGAGRAPRVRGRLFRKYVALFVAVVSVALLANGLFEIWFSYREHQDALVRIQR
jgi:hypothetical protein